jgi:1-deoxy-D-xylulose-5-phosphate reductoisomerase
MRTISLLGSTGSIGVQTLDVAGRLGIPVAALAADKSVGAMEAQARKFRPARVAMNDEAAARD